MPIDLNELNGIMTSLGQDFQTCHLLSYKVLVVAMLV